MKKKVMILLHGFKRNNEDDFGRIKRYLSKYEDEYEIHNVIWYDNYNRRTLHKSHMLHVLAKVAGKVNKIEPKETVIIAYSTGNIVAMYLIDMLDNKDNIRFFGTVPPFEVEMFKWVQRLKEGQEYKKKLRNKLGWRRYNSIQRKLRKQKQTEKYPLAIANYVHNKIIKPDGYRVGEIKNGKFLLALDDQVVNTKVAYRELNKEGHNNDITIEDFRHDQLFKLHQEVFIKWFEEKFNE